LSDYFAPVSPLPDSPALPVLLKMGNDVSTDEILPAGAKVLPYRSNIQKSKTLHSNAPIRPMVNLPPGTAHRKTGRYDPRGRIDQLAS
jgi:hypothetical protein